MIQSQLPVTERLKRVCEKRGIGIRPLHDTVCQRLGIKKSVSTLQHYWGTGQKKFKGNRIPTHKPYTRCLREVLMDMGVPRETLADLFDLDDRASTDLIWRELTDLTRRFDELSRAVDAIRAALPVARARKNPQKV